MGIEGDLVGLAEGPDLTERFRFQDPEDDPGLSLRGSREILQTGVFPGDLPGQGKAGAGALPRTRVVLAWGLASACRWEPRVVQESGSSPPGSCLCPYPGQSMRQTVRSALRERFA